MAILIVHPYHGNPPVITGLQEAIRALLTEPRPASSWSTESCACWAVHREPLCWAGPGVPVVPPTRWQGLPLLGCTR